ncbi:acetamidase regulatory protein (fungal specific transcription factor), partial [Colletotrichum musicola]
TCHQRKLRCDILKKGAPCSRCQTNKITDCRLYERKKTRTAIARAAAGANPSIQPRTDGSLTATSSAMSATSSVWNDGLSTTATRPSSTTPGVETRHPSELLATRNLAEFLNREDVGPREILHAGRLYFIGTEFSNLNYMVRQRSIRPDQKVLHFGSHPLAPKMSSVPPEALELPLKALADELVHSYFLHVNRGFPVVDEDVFMKQYRYGDAEVDGEGPRSRPLSLLLLNAILLVGAHVVSRHDTKALRPVFFHRAKTLFDCRFEQHRDVYIQAALLMTWQCDDLEDIVSNSWYWVGVSVRSAFGMGMHRDATPSSLNALDKRLWIRLWWAIFQFDVIVSTSHGRPQAINLDESDVPTLEEQHFDDTPNAESLFIIKHTELCIIFSKAMRKRTALGSTLADRSKATRDADEAFADLMNRLPERLQLPQANPDIWQSTFHLTYNNFLILLHRPSPRQNPGDLASDEGADLSICSDATATINSTFNSLRARNMLCKLWLPSIHVLFTALVHTSAQMRFANPLVASRAKGQFSCLLLTLHALQDHWMYAQSLLALFDGQNGQYGEPRQPHQLGAPHTSSLAEGESVLQQGGDLGISSPSNPLRYGPVMPNHSTWGSREVGGSDPAFPQDGGQMGYGHDASTRQGEQYETDLGAGEDQGDKSYGSNFVGEELDLAGDPENMDMLPLPSALEFLLAGAGNSFM